MDPSRGHELVNEMRLLHMALRRAGQDHLIARLTHVGQETKGWSAHLWDGRAPFALQAISQELHAIEQELAARGLRTEARQAADIRIGMSALAADVASDQADLRASLVAFRDQLATVGRTHVDKMDAPTRTRLQSLLARVDALAAAPFAEVAM